MTEAAPLHAQHTTLKSSQTRVRLAIYDFDGTCITGNSPVMLVGHLMKDGLLGLPTSLRIGMWALRYKFRLPQNESFVRSLVFKPFAGQPVGDVDEYLRLFYDEDVEERWRTQALESFEQRKAEGCVTVVVSATWETIAKRAQELHGFDHVVATRMQVDEAGNYRALVDGLPIEGVEKVRAIKRFADATFGEDAWEIAYAYGDHHSDCPLLKAAGEAFAVTPDKPLARAARAHGWHVLDWS